MLSLLVMSCGPTYVSPGGGMQGGYVEPIYQPSMSLVYFGGHQGYYDSYHSFHTVVVLNGSSGYYNSGGAFVSSSPAVREAAVSHKPFYGGPSTAKTGAQSVGKNSDPYGTGGGMGRSGSQSPPVKPGQVAPTTGRPNYQGASGSAVGQSTRVAPAPQPSRPAPSSGGMSRSSRR
jgi:hypothetical protein